MYTSLIFIDGEQTLRKLNPLNVGDFWSGEVIFLTIDRSIIRRVDRKQLEAAFMTSCSCRFFQLLKIHKNQNCFHLIYLFLFERCSLRGKDVRGKKERRGRRTSGRVAVDQNGNFKRGGSFPRLFRNESTRHSSKI